MVALPDVIPPLVVPALMPLYRREKTDQDLDIFHVGGIRPAGCYDFRIPEPFNFQTVPISGDYTRKIVSEDSNEKTLNQAARYILDRALVRVRPNRSLAFVAHDFGGSVVKRALFIASQEEEYSRVLEGTQLLILSGVPNRPCPKNGWLSPILSVFDSCFSGLRVPWTLKVLNRLAIEHDQIAKEFQALASRFRIISLYEANELAASKKATLSKDCATLGVAQEDVLSIADQSQLEYLHPSVLENVKEIIDNCVLSQEKDFKDFLRLLCFDEPFQFSNRLFDPTHIHLAEHMLSLPEVQPWLTSNSENKILRLQIGELIVEERLFDSLITAIKISKKHYHPIVTRVARHHQSPPEMKIGILASLIKQILRQKPQLYPMVSSLFPFVHDAALSRSPTWKQRVLWRCLETLLLSPRDVDTFLFVALDSIDHLDILSRIFSTTAKTAIRIRIAATITSLDRYPQNLPPSSHIDVDVQSDAFKDPHDSTTELDAGTHHLHLSPLTKAAVSMALPSAASLNVSEAVPGDNYHSDPGQRSLSSMPLLRDPSDHPEERTWLTRTLQSESVWLPLAVLWATRAERPLSVSEMNILLTLESGSYHNDYEYELAFKRDRASILPQILPGVLHIVNGTLIAGRVRVWEHQAEMVVEERLRRTVDSHFAETCLLYLLDYLQEGPVFRAIVGNVDKDGGNQVENEIDGRQRSMVKAKKEAVASLARYAALHWVTHWKLDGEESKLHESPGFKAFFAGGETVLEGWIQLLVDSSDILADSYIDEVKKVWQLLATTSLPDRQILEYVAFVYSHPSPDSLFDRLLVLGAELADEQFIKDLCDVASEAVQEFTTQNVARAIAAAPPSLITFLSCLPIDGDDAVLNKADIYLRATQLCNISVADTLLTDLRTQNAFPNSEFTDLLARALCIAYEYGDTDRATALEILARATPSSIITTTAKFEKALHMAVCAANSAAVLTLLDLGVSIEASTPTRHTPLLLASQRGLTSLVGILITEFDADVNATEVNGDTSLHFAAQSGFADIVRLLIDTEGGKASVMACNDAGDTPIVVAVKNGHVDIAKMLLETHFQNPDVGLKEWTGSDGVWETPRVRDEGMEDVDADAANDAMQQGRGYDSDVEMEDEADEEDSEAEHLEVDELDRILALRVTVMVEASKKGFLEIVRMLVGEVPEDTILTESKHGFVPLHCVAKSGFVDIAKLLCEQYPGLLNAADNDDSLTPLHIACYYGQKAIVDELLAHGPDLALLDMSSSRSPFTAACHVGALDVVRSILPVLQSPENENPNLRDLGLNEAARRAHREVVEYLLDHGASPNAIDRYANAALHWAAWNMDCRLMELLLLRRSDLDVKDEDGNTPLYDATRRHANDTVRMLVNTGADLNYETNSGRTPLDSVVYGEQPVLVRLLLDKGARMELCPYRKDDYRSMLNFALDLSSEEVVKVLLEFYARGTADESILPTTAMDVILDEKPDLIPVLLEIWPATKEYLRTNSEKNIRNIHSIASKGNVETLKAIFSVIDKDVVNTTMDTNGTLLHAAICGGQDVENKVNVLLEHEIDPSIVGGRHGTTLNAAAYFHLKSVAELILDKLPGGTVRRRFMNVVGVNGTCIQAAIMGMKNSSSGKSAVGLLELLRIGGAPLTHSGISGQNLLHAAAAYHNWGGSEDVITWLLEHGVDPNESDTAGRKPIHLAINTGDVDVVKLLLTKDTTLETLDHQRMNGLHYATLSKNWTMTSKLVDLYRGDDADKDISSFIEAQDVDDWTPLHWACRQVDLDIVKYLIEDCKASTAAKTKSGWTPWHVAVYHGITSKDYLKLLPEPPPSEQNSLPTGGITTHNAYCDICYADVFGDRYQCQSRDCYDANTVPRTVFDLCFKCYANHSNGVSLHIHGHAFERVNR